MAVKYAKAKSQKRTPRNGKPTSTRALARELQSVKAEVEQLRTKCTDMYQALLHMCCPKEWFTEEIDDEALLSQAIEVPSFEDWIQALAQRSDTARGS